MATFHRRDRDGSCLVSSSLGVSSLFIGENFPDRGCVDHNTTRFVRLQLSADLSGECWSELNRSNIASASDPSDLKIKETNDVSRDISSSDDAVGVAVVN